MRELGVEERWVGGAIGGVESGGGSAGGKVSKEIESGL
jgi:hypothetical protein